MKNTAIKKINDLIKSSNGIVFHLPIISMRSYDTNLYDLTCDGNFNRIVSTWVNVIENREEDTPMEIYIALPSPQQMSPNSKDLIDKVEKVGQGHLHFVLSENFPSGGPKQLRSLNGSCGYVKILEEIEEHSIPGIFVYEPEYFGVFLESSKSLETAEYKTVFWCPVSDTKTCRPGFLGNVRYLDLELAMNCDYLMVETENQKEYFKEVIDDEKIIVNNMMIDPSLSIFEFEKDLSASTLIDHLWENNYGIVYFPFRMTDPGYKFSLVFEKCLDLAEQGTPIAFVYTDPNDSHLVEEYAERIEELKKNHNEFDFTSIKVPSNRNNYYTFISDQRCIIPYLEKIDDILHASWQEMEYYKSTIIFDDETLKKSSTSQFVLKFNDQDFSSVSLSSCIMNGISLTNKNNFYK